MTSARQASRGHISGRPGVVAGRARVRAHDRIALICSDIVVDSGTIMPHRGQQVALVHGAVLGVAGDAGGDHRLLDLGAVPAARRRGEQDEVVAGRVEVLPAHVDA